MAVSEGLIDFGERSLKPFPDLLEELIDMLAEDGEALGCLTDLARLREITDGGTSADRQRAVHADGNGQAVVKHLIEEFNADL